MELLESQTGGTEISFDGTHNKFPNSSLPKSLWAEGDIASALMRDVTLKLEAEGVQGCEDKVNFTVLWVNITGRFSDSQDVSSDNAARNLYYECCAPHTYDLGPHMYWDRMGWGCEFIGEVNPPDFDLELMLDRDTDGRTYKGSNGDQLDISIEYSGTVPPGNDTSGSEWRDDAPQSGGSMGKVYDIDYPGTFTNNNDPANYIRRNRMNAKCFAVYQNVRASEFYEWYSKQSYKKTGSSSSGTATGGSSNTLQDTDQTWTTDEWRDGTVYIVSGNGSGQYRVISSNTSHTITVTQDWGLNPNDTSEYLINGPNTWTVVNDVASDNATGTGQLSKLTWNLE